MKEKSGRVGIHCPTQWVGQWRKLNGDEQDILYSTSLVYTYLLE